MHDLFKWKSPSFDLETAKKYEDTQVPEVIYRIIKSLDQNLNTECLYRKPGNKENILKLYRKLEKIRFDKEDSHDLASLLKKILTEMEEPLLPKVIFETYKSTSDQTKIKEALRGLTPVRKETLGYLMRHILRVTNPDIDNKMDKDNICVVWAPVVYHPLENRTDAEKCIRFFRVLMDVYDEPNKKQEKRGIEQSESRVDERQQKNYKIVRKVRIKNKAPQPKKGREEDSAGRAKESTIEENITRHAEDLKVKENGGQEQEEAKQTDSTEESKNLTKPDEQLETNHVTEEDSMEESKTLTGPAKQSEVKKGYSTEEEREDEKENDSTDEDKKLTGPAKHLEVKEDHYTEEKRKEEKAKDRTEEGQKLTGPEENREKQKDSAEEDKKLIESAKELLEVKETRGTDEKREKKKDSAEEDKKMTEPAKELLEVKETRATDEKREEEKAKDFAEEDKKLTEPAKKLLVVKERRGTDEKRKGGEGKDFAEGPAEELKVRENKEHTAAEKCDREKKKIPIKDDKTPKSEEGKQKEHTRLVQEKKGSNTGNKIKSIAAKMGIKTKEKINHKS